MTFLLAQAYGQGAYGQSGYGTVTIHIGPIVLPITGPTELALASAGVLALGIGVLVWLRSRRRKKLQA